MVAAFAAGATLAGSSRALLKQAQFAITLLGDEFASKMKPGERAHIGAPAVVRIEAGSAPGALLILDDRVILGWSSGALRSKPGSVALPLAGIKGHVGIITRKPAKGRGQLYVISLDKELPVEITLDSALMQDRAARIIAGVLNGELEPVSFANKPSDTSA